MKHMIKKLRIFPRNILLIFAISGLAATSISARAAGTVGMVTGPLTGTYYKIGKDVAKLTKDVNIDIKVKESNGSIENIYRITSTENAALGIVQSDVLGFLARSENEESNLIARKLRMVFPLYNEEVHVFASRELMNFGELNGKTVAVGREGSGSWLTAMNLFAMTNVSPGEVKRMSPPEAVVAVLTGKADAMIFVSGKPVKLFRNLEDLTTARDPNYAELVNNFHFIPLSAPEMMKEYSSSTITPQDYAFLDKSIPTIAATAVLVSYDFSDTEDTYAKHRCENIRDITQVMYDNIDSLKEFGHPKWQEVNLNAQVGYWQRDKCVAAPTLNSAASSSTKNPLEAELLNVIQKKW